ncbi:MAG: hypothetical protein JWP75_2523 [Frondihabitans sp.]|nr:hypothetical protein [Frondihabitans sp.]
MPTAFRSLPVRVLGATALVLLGSSILAGCTSDPVAQPASTPTKADQRPSAAASSKPTTSAPALVSTPLSIPCDTLVPAATVSSATPGMTAVAAAAPANTDAAVISSYGGTVCSWKSASGDTMSLAVGQFDDASLTKLKNSLVTSSNPVPTYNGEGYFKLEGKTGTAEAFSGSYWIVAISDTFPEPGGAEPIVDAAISALTKR